MNTEEKLTRAISLVKAGDKQAGGQLLGEVLQKDPENEQAWLWLSGVVDPLDERRYCLEQVLQINPANEAARRGLMALPLLQPGGRAVKEAGSAATPAVESSAEGTPGTEEALSRQELTDFVIRELGQHASRDEILYALCQKSGMMWSQAETFLRDVESNHRQKISRRRAPVLVVVGIVLLVVGVALFFYNFPHLRDLVQNPEDLVRFAPYALRNVVIQVVSLAMVLGGLLGIWRAISPSEEGMFSSQDLYGTGRQRLESADDLVDVGVWLSSDQDDDEPYGRRRRRRIRIL